MRKNQFLSRSLACLIVFMMFFSLIPCSGILEETQVVYGEETSPLLSQNIRKYINDAAQYQLKSVTQPSYGTNGGEWAVMDLARGAYTNLPYVKEFTSAYVDGYIKRLEAEVEKEIKENEEGLLHSAKSTEYSRCILALSALGKDVTCVAGNYDFTLPYADFDYVVKQGINGPIFALIALDTHGYKIPKNDKVKNQTTRAKLIQYILDQEVKDSSGIRGGWALFGEKPDPDITAMALQSLAPYYKKGKADLDSAIERAVLALSKMQEKNGGYNSWGTINSESTAQVIVALTALKMDPKAEKIELKTLGKTVSFVTEGGTYEGHTTNNVIDALLIFRHEPTGGFCHVIAGSDGGSGSGIGVNGMATDQALYALIAYDRFLNGQKSLYDMTDVKFNNREPQAAYVSESNLFDVKKDDRRENISKAETQFKDVKGKDWYAESIITLVNIGILKGKTANTFEPNANITRGEFTQILYEMAKKADGIMDTKEEDAVIKFKDVKKTDWYAKAVNWASEKNIVAGVSNDDGTVFFYPNEKITRQDMAVMIQNYQSKAVKKELTAVNAEVTFADANAIASYAKNAVSVMQKAGILSGIDQGKGSYIFAPKQNATRAEVATMTSKLISIK